MTDFYQWVDAVDFSWSGGYSFNRNQGLEALKTLAATDVHSFTITHSTMGIPTAVVVLNEDLDIVPGHVLQVTDTYSVDGATASNIIFEGVVTAVSTNYPKTLQVISRAIELLQIKPSGSITADSDGIISSIIGSDCDYVAAGALTDGADMGTITYAGDKDFFTILRNLAFFEGWIWYLKEPVSETSIALCFDNGSTSTGVTFSNTSNLWDFKANFAGITFSSVIVHGDASSSGSASATAEAGISATSYYHRDGALNTNALCTTTATNIRDVLLRNPVLVSFKYQDAAIGFVQPGQTMTLSYSLGGVDDVAQHSFVVNKITYEVISGVGEIHASSELTYDYDVLNFISQQLPQENSHLILQNSDNISSNNDIIPRTIPPYHVLGYNGFAEDTGYAGAVWIVSGTDNDARIKATFHVTKGGSFKVIMAAERTAGCDSPVSGNISMGQTADDGTPSQSNLINAENFDFTLTTVGDLYILKSTTTATVSDDRVVSVYYQKDANETGGNFVVFGIWLERQ